jgi:hypothetical protein
MGAVTYPNPEVQRLLRDRFVTVKLNVGEPNPDFTEILRASRPLWGPTFVFLDASKAELRRSVGYVPPLDFLAELRMVLGLWNLLHAQPGDAFEHFHSVARGEPASKLVPEALFWTGCAAYRRDGTTKEEKLAALTPWWLEVMERFPASTWADRASAILPLKRPGS